jgi:hypothetical protein
MPGFLAFMQQFLAAFEENDGPSGQDVSGVAAAMAHSLATASKASSTGNRCTAPRNTGTQVSASVSLGPGGMSRLLAAAAASAAAGDGGQGRPPAGALPRLLPEAGHQRSGH